MTPSRSGRDVWTCRQARIARCDPRLATGSTRASLLTFVRRYAVILVARDGSMRVSARHMCQTPAARAHPVPGVDPVDRAEMLPDGSTARARCEALRKGSR